MGRPRFPLTSGGESWAGRRLSCRQRRITPTSFTPNPGLLKGGPAGATHDGSTRVCCERFGRQYDGEHAIEREPSDEGERYG